MANWRLQQSGAETPRFAQPFRGARLNAALFFASLATKHRVSLSPRLNRNPLATRPPTASYLLAPKIRMVNPASATPRVSRAVRKIVWPVLRKHGFLEATSRSAWRSRGDTIDVVNFQAAVSSGGDPLFLGQDTDATLGSFSVNLGTYYSVRRLLPWTLQPMLHDSGRPPEYSCDERLRLQTSRAQAAAYPDTIWEVSLSTPESPARAVEDALAAIQAQGFPWFEQNADLERAMKKLGPVCWLWAHDVTREPDQFFRSEDLFAALAIRLNRVDDAFRLFEALAARSLSSEARASFDQEYARRRRRLAKSKQPLEYEPVPFWHDGALARLAALDALRVQASP